MLRKQIVSKHLTDVFQYDEEFEISLSHILGEIIITIYQYVTLRGLILYRVRIFQTQILSRCIAVHPLLHESPSRAVSSKICLPDHPTAKPDYHHRNGERHFSPAYVTQLKATRRHAATPSGGHHNNVSHPRSLHKAMVVTRLNYKLPLYLSPISTHTHTHTHARDQ